MPNICDNPRRASCCTDSAVCENLPPKCSCTHIVQILLSFSDWMNVLSLCLTTTNPSSRARSSNCSYDSNDPMMYEFNHRTTRDNIFSLDFGFKPASRCLNR